jgi:hypothetical protein
MTAAIELTVVVPDPNPEGESRLKAIKEAMAGERMGSRWRPGRSPSLKLGPQLW